MNPHHLFSNLSHSSYRSQTFTINSDGRYCTCFPINVANVTSYLVIFQASVKSLSFIFRDFGVGFTPVH